MRRNSHLVGAMIFGIIAFLILEAIRKMSVPSPYWIIGTSLSHIGHLFIMLISSAIGGLLPDILDPAYSRRHRRFAHSGLTGFIMIVVIVITLLYLMSDFRLELLFIYYFAWGYVSHLVLDIW